jgi:hypothetical protein
MFDVDRAGSVFAAVSPLVDVAASPVEPPGAPLERLEAQICELAGHLAAATCRFLVLLADFDARRDWPERYRQYLERTPRRTGPTLIPIQV